MIDQEEQVVDIIKIVPHLKVVVEEEVAPGFCLLRFFTDFSSIVEVEVEVKEDKIIMEAAIIKVVDMVAKGAILAVPEEIMKEHLMELIPVMIMQVNLVTALVLMAEALLVDMAIIKTIQLIRMPTTPILIKTHTTLVMLPDILANITPIMANKAMI